MPCPTAAYIYALNYARERIQGKHLTAGKDLDAKDVAIIEHPDVRRQLMTMKAYVDGMRSLIYYGGYVQDLEGMAADPAEKEKYEDLTAILTPIIKGYITDKALEVTSHAVQIYGGYGYYQGIPGRAAHAGLPDFHDLRRHQRDSGHGPAGPETGHEKKANPLLIFWA